MIEELLQSLPVRYYDRNEILPLMPAGTQPHPVPRCEIHTRGHTVHTLDDSFQAFAFCDQNFRQIYIQRPEILGTELWYHILYHEISHTFHKNTFMWPFDDYGRCFEELIAESTATLVSYHNEIYDIIEPLNSTMLSSWMHHMITLTDRPVPYHEIHLVAKRRATALLREAV